MVKRIIGGAIAMVIGGTTFAVSQTDVVNNFSKNTGMSQEQAQQYINNISEKDLKSFKDVGQSFIDDGNAASNALNSIDCDNYTYPWESEALSCMDGKYQLQTVGKDEVNLGYCFQALDTDLGSTAKTKMSECITDIDAVNNDYNFPIVAALLDSSAVTDSKNSNAYNKSILEAALNSH